MAPRQANRNIQKIGRQRPVPKHEKARPQGIQKERTQRFPRKSARLEEIQRLQERIVSKDRNTEPKHPLPSPTSNTPGKEFPQVEDQNRKRSRVPKDPLNPDPGEPLRKRRRTSHAGAADKDTCEQEATSGIHDNKTNPIDYWREKRRWPRGYFIQDDQTREDFRKDFEKDSWYEKYWIPEMDTNHLLARKKSSSSIRGKRLETSSVTPSSITPSDEKPRAVKSAPYQDPRYKTILATKGSFMGKSELGITDTSKGLCLTMFEMEQTVPQDSLFREDLFDKTCEKIQDRNEARVVQDITRLIIPSTEL